MGFEEEFYKDIRSVLYLFRSNYKMAAEFFKFMSDKASQANYDIIIEGKVHLKLEPSIFTDFAMFMDHIVVDSNMTAESNVNNFNILKAF